MDSLELEKARKSYLDSLQDSRVTPELLREMLVELEKKVPALYQPGSGENGVDPDPLNWSAEYFSRHRTLARQNFSRERIEHLLDVRAHLRAQKVKGFVPKTEVYDSRTESADGMASHYIPSDNLQKFVKEGELNTIRAALMMELHDNSQTSADLRNAIDWTKKKVPELFKVYTQKAFARKIDTDKSQWSSDYYNKQVVYLEHNFSEKRFLHVIDVRERLRQQNVEGFVPLPPKPRTSQPQSSQSPPGGDSPSRPEHNPVFKTALMVGGAVAALAILLIALMK
ncbi:hypothetical protein [Salinicola salarius]|uniref:hypothetical protein n=1 Tax=Salinicola salarius TaxID=430457 RepID=UPI001ABF95E0|nr:hypothetical protein [Salinicola salarius]